jgi:hypothetical protein
MDKVSDLINEPDASRLIFGLRDTGYNFRTAAADIIDNSIAANAGEVRIRLDMNSEGRKFVYFGDNGDGMNEEEVHKAMRYGAPVRQSLASLGKFGLGLKTASSSVCRHFAVISRKTADAELTKLAWDLDHVEETGKWQMRQDPLDQHELDAYDELCGDKGTLVVWTRCDRLLSKNYADAGGSNEQQAIKRLRGTLRDHIGLIYHRFLDKDDVRQRDVSIWVNDEPVEPWNPFFPERAEQVLSDKQQVIEMDTVDGGSTGKATIRAWILPNSNTLNEQEKKKANITNRGQGFYIYREGRLINQGGWLGVFGAHGSFEPHMSLLRIEFDFGHDLDEAFYVDVKKSRILFDPAIEDHLQKLLNNARREAENRYRRKQKAQAVEAALNHTSANVSIGEATSTKKPIVNEVDADAQTAVVTNNMGARIKIHHPVESNVSSQNVHVDAVDDITSGELWVPAFRSAGSTGHVPAVRINKHHDFYQKIYLRAGSSGYAIQGMDLLLWAFAVAEIDHTNPDMQPVFEDIREVVSSNLRKLLRSVPMPSDDDLKDLVDDGDE